MSGGLEAFIQANYNYEIDEESYGTFSRKDNDRCLINFSVELEEDETGEEYSRLKIELFQCFPPIGSVASGGVPRSGGSGREMMMYFLMFMKTQFPNIRTVFLEAEAFPDAVNISEEEYQAYYSAENLPLYQRILEQYYNSLGFTLDESGWFEGYIDHIIRSIKNYDNMKSFNANINPEIEREMLESFGLGTPKKGGKRKTNKKKKTNRKKKTTRKKKTNKKRKGKGKR